MRNPRLDDVAREAGVSPTTVSRVLNNRGYISERTRERVFEAMTALNYTPNAVARSLRDSRSRLVGLIFPSVAHPFYGHMAKELEVRLSREGYLVLLCNSDGQEATERAYLQMLLAHQVDGIITGAHSSVVASTADLRAPLVTIDRETPGPHPNVRSANAAASREVTRGLVERGARRIVHLTSSRGGSQRADGYREAMREAGLDERVVHVQRLADWQESPEAVQQVLDACAVDGGVNAVVASNDTLAMRALGWARARGIRVPDELQVVGFDGALASRHLVPELSTVIQPYAELAETAAGLLTRAIAARRDSGPRPGPDDATGADAPPSEAAPLVVECEARVHWGGTTRVVPPQDSDAAEG
ncbi:MAG: LacI family DNA-binding transcriptional regulator [Dermabacter sp.]|nr:LacI family DNA-binding transcriptional regulator [Dermabacter sp.]